MKCLTNVVFPEPLAPTKARNWPRGTLRSMPCRTGEFFVYQDQRSTTSRAASVKVHRQCVARFVHGKEVKGGAQAPVEGGSQAGHLRDGHT